MKLKIDKIEHDWEMELIELERREEEVMDSLPKGFWSVGEWNKIVQERLRYKARVELVKRKLSESKV